MTLNVLFFSQGSGKEPVKAWLKKLSHQDQIQIGQDIDEVRNLWPVGMPLVRKLNPKLWEIRSRLRDGIARVFFTIEQQDMILIHGLVKKTQKTPKADLELSQQRIKQWTRTQKNE